MKRLFEIVYSIVCIGVYVTVVTNVAAKRQHSDFSPSKKWMTELFSDAQKDFSLKMTLNAKCRNDYQLYLSHLQNQTLWAVRMKESTEWPSVGLYSGMVDHMGNWAECLKASGPNHIKGKYCLAAMTIKNIANDHSDSVRPLTTKEKQFEECSAWSMLEKYSVEHVRAERRIIRWAICLPSSCSSEDLEKSLENIVTPIFNSNGLTVKVNVDSSACSTGEEERYPKEFYFSWYIILSLIVLVTVATLQDIFIKKYDETKGWLGQILACFSAKRNFQDLVETNEQTGNILYFVKFLFSIFVVMAHRWTLVLTYPIFQAEEVEEYYLSGKIFFMSQWNGLDVFFLISGFLFYKINVNRMKTAGFPFVGRCVLFRWLTTLPIHGMVILFMANIFPHLGDGPVWKSSQAWMSQPCKTYWRPNLLLLNNYRGAHNMCLIPTWHLAVDFQISLIGAFLLFSLTKNRRLGKILIGLALILSCISTGLVSYLFGINGFYVPGIGQLRYSGTNKEFTLLYFAFYPRLSPFLVGMIMGIIIEMLKTKNRLLPRGLSFFVLFVNVCVGIFIQYHGFTLVHDTRYSAEWKAIFAGFYRPFYVLPYAVLFTIYFTSGIGLLDFLFKRKIFFVLGKLSLPIVLCSYIFQTYHVAIQRSLMPTSNILNIDMWSIADVIISLPLALIVYFIIDGPFHNLISLLKIKLRKSESIRRQTEKSTEMKTK